MKSEHSTRLVNCARISKMRSKNLPNMKIYLHVYMLAAMYRITLTWIKHVRNVIYTTDLENSTTPSALEMQYLYSLQKCQLC